MAMLRRKAYYSIYMDLIDSKASILEASGSAVQVLLLIC
jgi:hypothetical protein